MHTWNSIDEAHTIENFSMQESEYRRNTFIQATKHRKRMRKNNIKMIYPYMRSNTNTEAKAEQNLNSNSKKMYEDIKQ